MARVRSNGNTSLMLVGIIFAIVGLVFVIPGFVKLNKINNGDLLNLNEASKSDFKSGVYAEITLNYDYGCYAEYVETTNYVIKRTTQKYYLVDAGADDAYYLGVRVAAGDADELENLSYASVDSTKTVTYKGILRSQSGDAQKYYEEFIEDMYNWYYDMTAEDWAKVDEITLPYYLEIISPSSTKSSIVIGFIFVILGIFLVVLDIMKKKKAKSTPAPNPMTYGADSYDPNAFGNYTGNDMSSGNPYDSNPYGGDPMNSSQTPYSPGDAAANNGQTNPYQDPFYQQQQSSDTTNGLSSDTFSLKN